jgi:hypothetical protein
MSESRGDGLEEIAKALGRLGVDHDNPQQMGAIEGLGIFLPEKLEKIADGLQAIAASLDRVAQSIRESGKAIGDGLSLVDSTVSLDGMGEKIERGLDGIANAMKAKVAKVDKD